MKTQLIKTTDKFILVSDEEITKHTKPCYCYNSIKNTWDDDIVLYQGVMPMYHYIGFKKIIAGIPNLPSIDFSSDELGEEGRKRIGYVDVEKLALNYVIDESYLPVYKEECERAYINGFKTAQSLTDKMFSLKQVSDLVDSVTEFMSHNEPEEFNEWFEKKIQSLQQTSWDVEVVMKDGLGYLAGMAGSNEIWAAYPDNPKITNNSINVTKIL